MSRFFRAKKKIVSMAGGSGAGRKIIKAHLGEDGVTMLRVLKTVTLKLHGKKQSRSMKKSIMKFAVKGGYLFKNNKLSKKDAKNMYLPMEKLFKNGIDSTKKDGEAAAAANEGRSKTGGETKEGEATHNDSEEEEEEDDDDEEEDIPTIVTKKDKSRSSNGDTCKEVPKHLQPYVQAMSEQLIELNQIMQMVLRDHMQSSNLSKLSKIILFYSDVTWLSFFLTSEQCREERVSTHRIFSRWYDSAFRSIVEERERKEALQRQYAPDMKTFNGNLPPPTPPPLSSKNESKNLIFFLFLILFLFHILFLFLFLFFF
jgi:hypothetical protein